MSDTSGPTSPLPLAIYGPHGSSSKTWQVISLWGWETFSGTLPSWGMTRGGALFERPMPGHLTGGNACSWRLATPTAWLGRRPSQAIGDPARWQNPQRSRELSDQLAHLFPTRRASEAKGVGDLRRRGPGMDNLTARVKREFGGEPMSPPSDDGRTSWDVPLPFRE